MYNMILEIPSSISINAAVNAAYDEYTDGRMTLSEFISDLEKIQEIEKTAKEIHSYLGWIYVTSESLNDRSQQMLLSKNS